MYIRLQKIIDILPEDLIISLCDEYKFIDGYLWRGKNNTKAAIKKAFQFETFDHPLSNVKKGRFEPEAIYLYDQSSLYSNDWHVRKIDFKEYCKELDFRVSLDELSTTDYWMYEMTEEEQTPIELFFECY